MGDFSSIYSGSKKLGFGLMRLPLLNPGDAASIDLEQMKQMVDTFIERGFTYFDTAWMYCAFKSEEAVREALVKRHDRSTYTLATKLHAGYLKTKEDRDRIFQEQLRKTGADYFDYYLLHDVGAHHYEIYKELDCFTWIAEKKKQGLIRHMGFSFHDNAEFLDKVLTEHPEMEFYPRTFIFGAKASAGYATAKKIIKLINSVADVVNNDASINGKIKVVFIENYRVSNAEWIFAAADVSEQISTASKEASGTGNMKFMLNGAPTLGTMDGANVEIVEEVGAENAFIFGLSSDEVINYENNGGYDPNVIYNTDEEIRQVLMQLINGTFSNDTELFRDLYDSLLNTKNTDRADRYFILADFRSYADAQKRVEAAYRDEKGWAKKALLNTACSGKFTSDRTIQEYVDDIWHLDKVIVRKK